MINIIIIIIIIINGGFGIYAQDIHRILQRMGKLGYPLKKKSIFRWGASGKIVLYKPKKKTKYSKEWTYLGVNKTNDKINEV